MFTYKEAGVDREKARDWIEIVSRLSARTREASPRTESVGGFAARVDPGEYEHPVLALGCDGVGTKYTLLKGQDRLDVAGWDLVAMNVNDVLTTGAKPVSFLDYVAMEQLDVDRAETLLEGMVSACERSDCVLAGGETAELPGVIPPDTVELAGFCVGLMEKAEADAGEPIREGDRIVGFPSRGFHANGYSLIRRILRARPNSDGKAVSPSLLTRTRIYTDVAESIRGAGFRPKARVHVTGGGIPGNLGRVLPEGMGADLRLPPWNREGVGMILREVRTEEAIRTFNMGFGWLIVLGDRAADELLDRFPEARSLGRVQPGGLEVRVRDE